MAVFSQIYNKNSEQKKIDLNVKKLNSIRKVVLIYFKLLIIQGLQLLKELAALKHHWESHHKGKALRITDPECKDVNELKRLGFVKKYTSLLAPFLVSIV